MKRLAASILLLVYFTVTTGFAVSVGYCMNKRVSVDVGYHGHDEDCGKCGMNIEKSGGCCGEDVKVVKLQLDQNLVKSAVPDFGFALAVPTHGDLFVTTPLYRSQAAFPLAHAPPSDKQHTYLHNRVFRL